MMQALVGPRTEEAGLVMRGIVDGHRNDAHQDDAAEGASLIDRCLGGFRSQSLELPAHPVDEVGGVEAGGVQPGRENTAPLSSTRSMRTSVHTTEASARASMTASTVWRTAKAT